MLQTSGSRVADERQAAATLINVPRSPEIVRELSSRSASSSVSAVPAWALTSLRKAASWSVAGLMLPRAHDPSQVSSFVHIARATFAFDENFVVTAQTVDIDDDPERDRPRAGVPGVVESTVRTGAPQITRSEIAPLRRG